MVTPLAVAVAVAVKGLGGVAAAVAGRAPVPPPSPRGRAIAALAALVLAPLLLLGELWDSTQIVHLRHHPTLVAAGLVVGLIAVAALAALLHKYTWLIPLLAVGVLPFRVPFESGGQSAS